MFKGRRGCCCGNAAAGYFFIAVGLGVFLAYAIPRYILIMLLGLALIGLGAGIIRGKDRRR